MKKLIPVILTCILLTSCTRIPSTEVKPPVTDTAVEETLAEEIENQYEGITFKKAESDLLYTVSREDCVLPLTFEYNGKTVTVNAPIYTGIPAESVSSYKKNFIFRDEKISLDVATDKGTKSFLIDKSGICLDMEYSGTNDDSDISSMTKLPSDDFTFTGYVYNGICPIVSGRRLGFADSQGNVLLEPCIEMDYLTTFPKNRDYVPYFMNEDTILLPISGEFAIITLTRTESHVTPKPAQKPLSELHVPLPEVTEPKVPDEIMEVLENRATAYDRTTGDTKLLSEIRFTYSGKTLGECTEPYYAFADLDGDGLCEVLLTTESKEVALLHYDGTKVWYMEYIFNSISDILADGTYHTARECWRTVFDKNSNFTLKPMWEMNKDKYFVEGKLVTKDVFSAYSNKFVGGKLDLIPYYLIVGIDKDTLNLENIPAEYLSTVKGETPFYMDGKEKNIADYCFPYLLDRFSYYTSVYSSVDMDGDGVKEVLIGNAAEGDTLVLYLHDGKVMGREFVFRNMLTKFEDGTYTFTIGASMYGRCRLVRNGDTFSTEELTREEISAKGDSVYFVNGIETTQEEYYKVEATYSNTQVEFVKFIKNTNLMQFPM